MTKSRKLHWLTLLLLLLCTVMAAAQTDTVGLDGTINNPDGSGFNGTMTLKLTVGNVKNICVGPPYGVVPNVVSTYTVQNGVIVNGTSANLVVTDCLSPRVPYYVQLFNTAGRLQLSDNWYVKPPNGATNLDVGLMASTNFTGPITVSVPQAIVWNPTGNQTITQPTGTVLTVNNLTITGALTISSGLSLGSLTVSGVTNTGNEVINGTLQAGASTLGSLNDAGTLSVTGASTLAALTASSITDSGIGTGLVCASAGLLTTSGCSTGALFYQTVMAPAGASFTQRAALAFNNNNFAVTDDATHGSTDLDLTTTGVSPGSYTNASITVDSFGRISSATSGPAIPTFTGTSGYQKESSGLILEWGNTPDLGAGTLAVSFPLTFPHACFTVTATTVSTTDRITYLNASSGSTPCTATGFTVGDNGSSASASWIAVGY